jgi:putative peptidoglycan lipid II flippase
LKRIGYLSLPRFNFAHPQVREVMRRMAPTLFGIGVYYIDVVVARRLLSELGTGAQSYFGWALRLCDFPQGIFVMALQTAMLPSLSSLAARSDHEELKKTFLFGFKIALFVGIGATALLFALAHPAVALILQRGKFDALATRETGYALMAQASAIWAIACSRQLVAVFFALGDTRTPVLVAACDFLVFVALALSLMGLYGHVGVSLAVAGAAIAQMLMLSVLLQRRLGVFVASDMLGSAGRSLTAAACAGAAAWAVAGACSELVEGALGLALPGLLGGLTFVSCFICLGWLLKSPELFSLLDPLRRRFKLSAQA